MAIKGYGATVLTGGGTGALDAIDGANLNDLDVAVVVTLLKRYVYSLDDDSGAAESSPDIISPDSNAGTKRWILVEATPTGTIVGTSDTQTLTNKTLTTPALSADSVDAITEIAAALKSGADATLITGTKGTDGDLAQWNADGDLVDGPTPPTGTIVGHTDTQTLSNKTLTSPVLNTGVSGTAVKDEDNMASDSATHLSTQQAIKAYADNLSPRSYLSGLTLSNDTDTEHDINITAGEARDSTNAYRMVLSSEITKQIDATWAAGDDAGGMNDGESVGNSTWYHVHLLYNPTTRGVDVGFDTSLTAANLLADTAVVAAGHTKYRRIGSVLTDGSANILAFTQVGDHFIWSDPALTANSGTNMSGTTAALEVVAVPTGVKCLAHLNIIVNDEGNATLLYISSPDATDEAPSSTVAPLYTFHPYSTSGGTAGGSILVMTDTSAQVRHRSSRVNTDAYITTLGYQDFRGKND